MYEITIKVRKSDGADYPAECALCGAPAELAHYRIISPGGLNGALCEDCLGKLFHAAWNTVME